MSGECDECGEHCLECKCCVVEYHTNFRFPSPNQVKMLDSEGKVILCRCGNPAGSAAMGIECYIVWCDSCGPLISNGNQNG